MINVVVVEDDPILRRSFVEIIDSTTDCRCTGAFASGEEAVSRIPKLKPNVAVMDINLPGIDGIECVRQLAPVLPDLQIVMLTVYQDAANLFNALAAGASGYLVKPARAGELLGAIRDLDQGGAPMTGALARKVVEAFRLQPKPSSLQPDDSAMQELAQREQEVLDLLAQGFSYKEIADKLGISFSTVHTYVQRIYKKLHVRSKNAAVARWLGYRGT